MPSTKTAVSVVWLQLRLYDSAGRGAQGNRARRIRILVSAFRCSLRWSIERAAAYTCSLHLSSIDVLQERQNFLFYSGCFLS